MNKKNIGTTEVTVPSATPVAGVIDGAVEVSEKISSEPVSDNMHNSGEGWEHELWETAMKV